MIDSVKGIIEAKSANYLDELNSLSSPWDGEIRLQTKYDTFNFYIQFWFLIVFLKMFLFILSIKL